MRSDLITQICAAYVHKRLALPVIVSMLCPHIHICARIPCAGGRIRGVHHGHGGCGGRRGVGRGLHLHVLCATTMATLQNIPGRAFLRATFRYSTVQVNFSYAAKLHVDKNNMGPSLATGLGSFEDGELWIIDR